MAMRHTEILEELQASGLGLVRETNLFGDHMPNVANDPIVVVKFEAGGPPDGVMGQRTHHENPTIVCWVRASDPDVGEALAYNIWTKLGNISNATLNGADYKQIQPQGSPQFLDPPDSRGRRSWFMSFDAKRGVF